MKRAFDLVFSCIALMIFGLPMLFISFWLRSREKHPVLFKQERIGKFKRPFEIFKFQTMLDQKVTTTGTVLRRTGLDELPQFLNVLRGDMSIVGPRALTDYDVQRLGWDDEFHKRRWQCRPGITGLAQLYGGQHRKTSWFWDQKYIGGNHLVLDFGIILASFCMNILGKTRVRRILFKKQNLK